MSLLVAASFSSQFGRIVGATGLVFLMVGIGLVAIARIAQRRRAAFESRATAVPAEVVDYVWHVTGASGANMSLSLLAFPLLRYRLPDGTVIEQESFEGASPPRARTGSVVTVLYDPADPRRVRVVKASVLPTLAIVCGGICAGVGALMVVGTIALLVA
jgi:Protein of unknown function (DUF3592)